MSSVTYDAPPALNGEMRNRVQQLRLDGQLSTAKTGSSRGGVATWLPWGLAFLLGLAWGGVALRTYRNAPDAEASFAVVGPASSTGSATNTSTTSTASESPSAPAGTVQLEVKGYIISAVKVNVSPIEVSGRLLELYFKEGQFIKVGDPLAKIDATSFQYALNDAQQAVNAARERRIAAEQRLAELNPQSVRAIEREQLMAQIDEAKAVKARSDDELARVKALGASVSGREVNTAVNDAIASENRVKKLEIDLRILDMGPRPERIAASKAELAAALADVKSAEAKLGTAQWRVENCIVRAPFTGTVTEKGAEIGSLVNPAAFGNISASICTIADLSDLEVELEIPEKDIPKLTTGQTCRVRADAYPNRLYAGKLDRIMPIADRAKSTVKVRVKIVVPTTEAQGSFLKLEMGAVVSFIAGDTPSK